MPDHTLRVRRLGIDTDPMIGLVAGRFRRVLAAVDAVHIGVLAVLLALVVTGCNRAEVPTDRGEIVARAQAASPTDPRLAALYAGSCKACHVTPDSGAPLTGDRAGWAPHWAKGMPALLQSTISGVGSMPPGGQCFACAPADYEALIRFMADQGK